MANLNASIEYVASAYYCLRSSFEYFALEIQPFFCSQFTITNACEDHYRFVLFLQALLSSVKNAPVLPAWKTVKRMKKK